MHPFSFNQFVQQMGYLFMDNDKRLIRKRDLRQDYLKYQENVEHLVTENKLIEKHFSSGRMSVFIIGSPRSGTTLLSQLLSEYFDFGFISKRIASYFLTPLVGLQKLNEKRKTNLDYRVHLSEYGDPSMEDQPHEFGFFWQMKFRHLSNDEQSDIELNSLDWKNLSNHLSAMSGYAKKPFLHKNPVYTNFKVCEIHENVPNSHFIYIKRKPEYVIQSILNARLNFYGDINEWWSIRPRSYSQWQNLDPVDQVYNQVSYVQEYIENSIKLIGEENSTIIDYENLVNDPKEELGKVDLAEKKNDLGRIEPIISKNRSKIDSHLWNLILSKVNKE